MASHFEDEDPQVKECANCSSCENLSLCSRCRSAYFCSVKCQKAYWPFHREWCRRNDFADALEKTEPKFARWMRQHGKQAVLKDDEVDRLERKVCTYEDLYGRSNPKPLPPSFSAEEMEAMRLREEREMLALRGASRADEAWKEIEVAEGMGMELGAYKWTQDQSRVEVYVRLPAGCSPKAVQVELGPERIEVVVGGERVLGGELWNAVILDESTWTVSEGVLEVSMLKKSRRGHYDDGKTNADTFWFSVLRRAGEAESLPAAEGVPNEYYSCNWEKEPKAAHKWRGTSGRPMIDRSKER